MSDLWPDWRNDEPPLDGRWFTARKGLSGYITRAKFDADHVIWGTAYSDRTIGSFVDESGNEISVGQWWPEGEGQPAVPAMPPPTVNIINGMLEMNGAKMPRHVYSSLFSMMRRSPR